MQQRWKLARGAAAQAFREAVRLEPADAVAWYNLGNAYFHLTEYDKAKKAFQEAIRLEPTFADAWNNLGVVAAIQGDRSSVIHVYEQLKVIEPERADKFFNGVVLPQATESRTTQASDEQEANRPKPCPVAVYLVGVDLNDGTEGIGWMTENMRAWWDQEGRIKHSDVCFTDDITLSAFQLHWNWYQYDVPVVGSSGRVTGYWHHREIRVTVYQAGTSVLLHTNTHHGRWAWSKPDKDALKEAVEFLSKHGVRK